jgi:hypothetical protein
MHNNIILHALLKTGFVLCRQFPLWRTLPPPRRQNATTLVRQPTFGAQMHGAAQDRRATPVYTGGKSSKTC